MVFHDERLSLRKMVGVGLGFFGVVVAIGLDSVARFDLRSLAQIAVIGGTLSYACAASWARATLSGLHPIVAAAGMLTGASLIMVPAAFVLEGAPSLALQPKTIVAIAYYALAATAFAYLLYYRVLAMAGSGNLMICTLLIPPVAILLGAFVRGEILSPNAYLGFALLALGLVILDGRILKKLRRP